MAILDIYTENKDVSWVIRKNPQTQQQTNEPFMRTVRKGVAYGWYTNDNHFRIWFKEGNGQSSFYKNLDNNYLNQSAYNCAYAYCSLINEMLSATVKECHEKDIALSNKVVISAMVISLPTVAQFFIKYFADDISINMEQLANKAYNITFSGNVSLYKLLNLVQVFCLVQSLEDKNIFVDMTTGALQKYAQALKNIAAPYFIAYVFLSRCVPDQANFNKVKDVLQQDGWQLFYGNTQKQRYDQIKKHMQKGKTLHDIGCGELYYSRHLANVYEQVVAWDADEVIQRRNSGFIAKKNINNILLQGGFSNGSAQSIEAGSDLLITEMLEHMPKDDAKVILENIRTVEFRRLIITVPNSDFNQYYKLEGAFRHDDHYWEPTYEETVEWINSIFNSEKFDVVIKKIGDGINGNHVSTMVIIEHK